MRFKAPILLLLASVNNFECSSITLYLREGNAILINITAHISQRHRYLKEIAVAVNGNLFDYRKKIQILACKLNTAAETLAEKVRRLLVQ